MILRLAIGTLRRRKIAFACVLTTLVAAAALVGASAILLETGLRGRVAPERYAGTPLVVAADQNVYFVKRKHGKAKLKSKPLTSRAWLSASVAEGVRAVSGVERVTPELDFPAYVEVHGQPVGGPNGSASWGHAWTSASLTPFALREGRPPTALRDVVVDRGVARRGGLRVGSTVVVQATGAPTSYRVVGIASARTQSGELAQQAALFFSPGAARALAGRPDRIAALGVVPARGTNVDALRDRIEAVIPPSAKVYTGNGRGSLEFLNAPQARLMLISVAGTFGGTAILVAVLVVVGIFALTIQQRRRELALLRAIAATPRQIEVMVGREALLVGLLASVLGSAAAVEVARWLRLQLVHAGAVPANFQLVIDPLPILGGGAVTVLAGWLAARFAARRTSDIRPVEALAEAEDGTRRLSLERLVAGGAIATGAAALTAVLRGLSSEAAATPVLFLTTLAWMCALALLSPPIDQAAARVIALPLGRLSPASGQLAAANTITGIGQLASIVPPLALAVAIACTTLFAQSTLNRAAERQFHAGMKARYALTAPAPGVPMGVASAARRAPGVSAVTEVMHTTVRGIGLPRYEAEGVTSAGLERTIDPDVQEGSLHALGDGSVAMSTAAADRIGARVGGTVQLRLADGTPVDLHVVGIYRRGLGFGDLILSRDLVAAHVDDPLADSILINAAPTVRLPRLLQRSFPGVRMAAVSKLGATTSSQQDSNTAVQYLFVGLIVAFAAIAVVNTIAVTIVDRAHEFEVLRLIGTTRTQARRMITWETTIVIGIAVAIGSAVGAVSVWSFSAGMAEGRWHVPPFAYLAVVGSGALLALVVSTVSTAVALRTRPTTL